MIEEKVNLERGMIVVWWSNSFFGKLQQFFTRRGSRWYDRKSASGKRSHVSILYDRDAVGNWRDIDVTTKVKLSNFDIETKQQIWIYKIKDVPDYLINQAVEYIWNKYHDRTYAYLQLLYYPRRWFWEPILNNKILNRIFFGWLISWLHKDKDIRRWGNWFPQNGHCSEASMYDYCMWLCGVNNVYNFEMLSRRLDQWDGNNLHAWDAKIIIEEFPEVFELVFTNT